MKEWAYVLDQTVFQNFISQPPRMRRRLIDLFDSLRTDPFQVPENKIKDTNGRELNVVLCQPFMIAYWNDLLIKEVRIVDIQTL